ncbi:MAG: chemotaxis protein CheW [Anaerolineales bacterium]
MSISANVREKLLNSFRVELQEHIQTMTDGLLALEQETVAGDARQATLEEVFRAAHSLKGAARALGVTMIEQLAHALENILDALRRGEIEPTPEMYTVCYEAFDAIQNVQAAYEAGKVTPPAAALQALAALSEFHPAEDAPSPAAGQPAKKASVVADYTASSQGEPQEIKTAADGDVKAPSSDLLHQPDTLGSDETIRVKVDKLDALMAQLSELLVTKIRAEQRLVQLREIEEGMALWQKDWLAVRSAYSRLVRHNGEGQLAQLGKDMTLLVDYIGASQDQLREMNTRVSNLSRQYANDTMHMSLVIDELEEEIKRVRMLPLRTITGPFRRMVRDLAKDASKEAILHIAGEDTELDKRVLEQIKDPLIHLLRNAVDHGIEPPEVRMLADKPRAGHIYMKAEQQGKDIVISVRDDGRGLDLEAIRETVAERDPDMARVMNEAELKEAIFQVGISTSPIVTDISGRGLGLDIVRRSVEALHGRIDIETTPDAGSVFEMILPLTLSSSRGLLVTVADQQFAIPLTNIERIQAVAPTKITALGGHDAIHYNERTIPLVRLGDVLGLSPSAKGQSATEGRSTVILASAERRIAFLVDSLDGEQEIVVKSLGKQLARVKGIAGATVMGDGEIVLILNVADAIKMALRGSRRASPGPRAVAQAKGHAQSQTRKQRDILIVDDSITTRTLERNILEAAGYHVRVAIDGQEAWDHLATGDLPELVVSDVSMPRLDGIGLTKRIKNDARTAQLPVILVTSLDSPEDKARGVDAGADAYITKGAFDQDNLLGTIEQLI